MLKHIGVYSSIADLQDAIRDGKMIEPWIIHLQGETSSRFSVNQDADIFEGLNGVNLDTADHMDYVFETLYSYLTPAEPAL